jgi:hypothetical protein
MSSVSGTSTALQVSRLHRILGDHAYSDGVLTRGRWQSPLPVALSDPERVKEGNSVLQQLSNSLYYCQYLIQLDAA